MSLKLKAKSIIFLISTLFWTTLPGIVLAQKNLGGRMTNILNKVAGGQGAGFDTDYSAFGDTSSLAMTIGGYIRVVLSFLGIIFFIFIIYSGFLWMTAGGNKEQIGKAKDMVKNAAIGLIIVMTAYAISAFIMAEISTAGVGVYG